MYEAWANHDWGYNDSGHFRLVHIHSIGADNLAQERYGVLMEFTLIPFHVFFAWILQEVL